MKKIFALLLIFVAFKAQGQFIYHFTTPQWYDKLKVDSIFMAPSVDTSYFSASKYPGAIMRVGSTLYFSDSIQWRRVGSDTSSTDLSNYYNKSQVSSILDDTAAAIRSDFPTGGGTATDTTSLSNRIDTKLTATDTAGHWAPVGSYLHPADTTGKWAPVGSYLHPADTVDKWAPVGSVPTDNSSLANGRKYLTADSLQSHAAIVKYPLISGDSTLSIDTTYGVDSALVTHHQLDSVINALPAGGGSGITKIGQGWGLSRVNDSTNRVDSSKVASLQALKDSISAVQAALDSVTLDDVTATGKNMTTNGIVVGSIYAGTGEITDLTSSTVTIQNLSNNASEDSVLTVDTAGHAKLIAASLPDLAYHDTAATTYTLGLPDKHRLNDFTSSSAVTVTIPANATVAFKIGTVIILSRGGTGTVTISAASGVTINSVNDSMAIAHQYGEVFLQKIGTDTWRLVGDL